MNKVISKIGNILENNTYPGRGIVLGTSADGACAVCAYFIMGRSENSRNRVFSEKEDEITIYPYDTSKVSDPSLIIYNPVRILGSYLIVTNGIQTDAVYDSIKQGGTFEQALEKFSFEPDKPNFTPRISGIIAFDGNKLSYKMNIIKSKNAEGTEPERNTFVYDSENGIGHFLHTYKCDGNPIPAFEGNPETVVIPASIDEFTNEIWNNLNEHNKISLYVRYTDIASGKVETRLINKNI